MKAILVLMLLVASIGYSQSGATPKKVFFMYFMKGDGQRPEDKGELEKMQAAHLANLTEQFKNKNILVAGPLQDPTKERRGIVVLHVENEDGVAALFKDDPYVKNNIMCISLMEWKVNPDAFKTGVGDPNSIVPYRLVIFTPGKSLRPVNARIMKEHQDYMDNLKQTHKLGIRGEVSSAKKIREVAIFEGEDTKGIEAALSQDPLVKAALLEVEIIPLWMMKGTFGQ